MAEWLRRGLQNLLHRFNSGRRLQVLNDKKVLLSGGFFGGRDGGRTHMTFGQRILSPQRIPVPPLALK